MSYIIQPGLILPPGLGGAEAAPVLTNLIAWYKFDDASGQVLTDYSGNANHGQLGSTAGVDTNDPAWVTEGLDFTTDDFVNAGTFGFTPADRFTITFAIQLSPDAPASQEIFHKGVNAVVLRHQTNNTLLLFLTKQPSGSFSCTTSAVANTDWHLITICYDGASAFVELDGSVIGSVADAGVDLLDTQTGTIFIGQHNNGSSNRFQGVIASALIYSKALDAAEKTQNHDYLQTYLAGRGITLP